MTVLRRPVIGLNTSLAEEGEGELRISLPADYVQAVVEAGGIPLLIPPITSESTLGTTVYVFDGIILIGGKDYSPEHYGGHPQREEDLLHPLRDRFDLELVRYILDETSLPVLAICGGMQLLAIARGGKLIQDIPTEWNVPNGLSLSHASNGATNYHEVTITAHSLLARVLGFEEGLCIHTNSSHHQAVHPSHPGCDLIPSAFSTDGIVEALEPHPASSWYRENRFILGIQWHPERMRDEYLHRRIFTALIEAAIQT